tara:strand:+ start:313 stop:588 length:276 start_codon:yes stop_codon:yes gene_type:complete
MCGSLNPFKSSPTINIPPPPPVTEDVQGKAIRKREREIANREATQLKNELFEKRVAQYATKFGGRNLLMGAKGGAGFALDQQMLSRKTLGA